MAWRDKVASAGKRKGCGETGSPALGLHRACHLIILNQSRNPRGPKKQPGLLYAMGNILI